MLPSSIRAHLPRISHPSEILTAVALVATSCGPGSRWGEGLRARGFAQCAGPPLPQLGRPRCSAEASPSHSISPHPIPPAGTPGSHLLLGPWLPPPCPARSRARQTRAECAPAAARRDGELQPQAPAPLLFLFPFPPARPGTPGSSITASSSSPLHSALTRQGGGKAANLAGTERNCARLRERG